MRLFVLTCVFVVGCGGSDGDPAGESSGGSATSGGSAAVGGSAGSSGSSGGSAGSSSGGSGGQGNSGGASVGGSAGSAGSSGSGGTAGGTSGDPEDPDAVGVWVDVSPDGDFGDFGLGHVLVDPMHPSDLYISGGARGTWKSSDYGRSWEKISDTGGYWNLALGNASDGPPTIWEDAGNDVYKSTDGGVTWQTIGNGGVGQQFYSMKVDPYDIDHLISGTHESSPIGETTDGGANWTSVPLDDGMLGGASFYPFFIDTGDAGTTADRWLCIPQNSGGTWLTSDGGASFTKVNNGVHAHGNAQIYQDGPGGAVFMSVIYGEDGNGVYRSTDLGATFAKVDGTDNAQAITWGSEKAVYSMFGWAAGGTDVAPGFEMADKPATSGWQSVATPAGMVQGPNSVAVTKNGSSTVFVGNMWRAGIWRYIEP